MLLESLHCFLILGWFFYFVLLQNRKFSSSQFGLPLSDDVLLGTTTFQRLRTNRDMQNEQCGARSFDKFIFYAQIEELIWCIVEI